MGHNPARKRIGPGRVIKADSGAKKDDLTGVSRGIGAGEGLDMVKAVALDYAPRNGEMSPPVNMESHGRIQISRTDKKIVIELTTEI